MIVQLVTSRLANRTSGCAGPFLVSEHPGAFADEQLLRRYSPSMLTLYTHTSRRSRARARRLDAEEVVVVVVLVAPKVRDEHVVELLLPRAPRGGVAVHEGVQAADELLVVGPVLLEAGGLTDESS